MELTKLYNEFFRSEKAAGLLLIFCTLLSIILANSAIGDHYLRLWQTSMAGMSLEHWINEGLMALFFLLIGLELKREMRHGELSNLKEAMLPILGALGGMLIPAGIYLIFNYGASTQSGAGIPMATDIAFALGVLSLLGNKVPPSIKIFLTALAVIDDLGAILVIAIFYSKTLLWTNLVLALLVFGALVVLNRLKVKYLIIYIIGGIVGWYFMLHSGVHATIAGILLAFVIPYGQGDEKSLTLKVEHFLNKPVAFFILPVFALANTAIVLNGNFGSLLLQGYSLGIAGGLIIGKPAGIFIFTFLGKKLGLCRLPESMNWRSIFNVGFLAGIGFTMSIFIALLAFEDRDVINNAKFIILFSSLIAGVIGFFTLKASMRREEHEFNY